MPVTDTTVPAPATPPAAGDTAAWRMEAHWPDLAQAVTDQAIESVNHLLRGLSLLLQRGRLSEAEYHILAQPAQRLRQCSMHAQQIVRLHSGQVRQSHEKIDLAYVAQSVLQERREALAQQGIAVQYQLQPVELLIDPTLAYSLVQAALEWGLHLGSRLELRVEPRPAEGGDPPPPASRPTHAWLELNVRLDSPNVPDGVYADGLLWLLLQQLARADGGVVLQRHAEPGQARLTAQFRRTTSAVYATIAA